MVFLCNNDDIKFLKSTILFCALAPLLLCTVSLSFAQGPDTMWTKTYGGFDYDNCYSVQQTLDGGYILFGQSQSFGTRYDVYLIKTDSLGDTLWTRIYDIVREDHVSFGQQTTDGGYFIAGFTQVFSDVHIFLIKTDSLGDTVWTRVFSEQSVCYSAQQTFDSGYVIAGSKFANGDEGIYLVKTDSLGDTIWTRTYGGAQGEFCWQVQQTADDGYIVVGSTESFGAGGYDIWLLKTDENGDTLWTKTYGGSDTEYGFAVDITDDGGYILAGRTDSYGAGAVDLWLLKTDANGDTVWTKTYGGPAFDEARFVQQTTDQGYFVGGWTWSFGAGAWDIYLIKTGIDGDSIWTRTYGGLDLEIGHSAQQTSDQGYVIVADTWSFGPGTIDIWLLKMAPDTFGIEEHTAKPIEHDYLGSTILRGPLMLPKDKNCKVFDITGRVVAPDRIKPGIYFIEIDGKITRKVVKVR